MIFPNTTNIKDFAYLVHSRLLDLNKYLNLNKTKYQLIQLLDDEYSRINLNDLYESIKYKNGTTLVEDIANADHVYIITNIMTADSSDSIILDFIPNTNGPQEFQLDLIFTKAEFEDELYTNLGSTPSNMLYNFAYWPSLIEDLKSLKNDLALSENWAYKENPSDDDFPILKSYIKYTFSKIWKEKQLSYSYDNRFVSFNTGLVNKNYQYIYRI